MTNFAKPVAQRPQNWLSQLRSLSAANAAGGTEYTVEYPKREAGDTTPESERGVSVAITGNVETDHEGNTTGLTGWGQAVKNTSTGNWEKLGEDSGWITPTLLNGWTAHTGSPVQYRKQGNVVRVRGTVTGAVTSGHELFSLPTGFRPTDQYDGVGYQEGSTFSACYIRVFSTGSVAIFYSGTASFLGVNINFTND